jgi:hypothetical protein
MNARALPPVMLALFSAACTARAPRPEPLPDCAGADAYEFKIYVDNSRVDETFESDAGELQWFDFGDCTPRAVHSYGVETIPNGGRCGSQGAFVFRTTGHQDWGSGFGIYGWNSRPQNDQDASDYEGIAFWARAPGRSDKGITIGIGDRQSSATGGVCMGHDAGTQGMCGMPLSEPNTDAGLPPPPGACGNSWTQQIVVSEFWKLYLLPWESFAQEPVPSRVETLDPSGIFEFAINIPKDSRIELWLDDLGFYRRKPAGL